MSSTQLVCPSCEASIPPNANSRASFHGRVAVEHVQGSAQNRQRLVFAQGIEHPAFCLGLRLFGMEAHMNQRFWEQVEFGFLLLAQLVGLVWSIASLFPASAFAQTPIAVDRPQSAAAHMADPAPTKLGTFLEHYPITKAQQKLLVYESLLRLGEGAFVGYRAFKDKDAGLIAYKARESFGKECAALGGHFEAKANRADIAAHYSAAKQVTFNGNDLFVCVDHEEMPLGALIACSYTNRYKESFVHLFVMTKETASEMMVIYHRGMAKELRFQADMAERKINNEKDWAAWREKLTIGTETGCGPVIGLRGPMIEIAHNGQPSWFRREQLFPVGARDTPGTIIRCGTSGPL